MSARVSKLMSKKAIATLGHWLMRDGPKFTPEDAPERTPAMGPTPDDVVSYVMGIDEEEEISPRYLQREGIPLEWCGEGTADLDLSGIASEAMTAKVLQHGHGPHGEALRTEDEAESVRVLAYSVVYSAPKSVSLLIASPAAGVRAAAGEALRTASDAYLSALESQLTTRRGKAGVRTERIAGLIAVRALHQTSSTGDPHLHAHWMIAASAKSNVDGAYRALDGRQVFEAQKLAVARANRALYRALDQQMQAARWTLTESGSTPVMELTDLRDVDGALSGARIHMQKIADELGVPFALRSRKMDARLWRQHRERKEELAEKLEHEMDAALHKGGTAAEVIRTMWQDRMADAGLLGALQAIQPKGPGASRESMPRIGYSLLSQPRPKPEAIARAREMLQSVDRENLIRKRDAAHAAISRLDRFRAALLYGDAARAKIEAARALDDQLAALDHAPGVLDLAAVFDRADVLLHELTQVLGVFTPGDIAARLIVTEEKEIPDANLSVALLLRHWVASGQIHLRDGIDLATVCRVLENNGFSPVTADMHMATRPRSLVPDALVAAELALADQAKKLSQTQRSRMVISIPDRFAPEQSRAAAMLAQGRALSITTGVAGAGKSHLARPVVEAAQKQSFKVRVVARNRALAEALQAEVGADFADVFATFDPKKGKNQKTLLIVDESGLADYPDLRAVLGAVQNNVQWQAWLIGDRAQGQPIDRRAAFAVVETAVVPEAFSSLRTSWRCQAWDKEHDALRSLKDIPGLVSSIQGDGRLLVGGENVEDRRAKLAQVAETYRGQGEDVLVIARSNADAGAIAEYIQAHRGIEIHPQSALRYGQQAGVGDLVRTRQNDRQKNIKNGDVWSMVHIRDDGALVLQSTKNPRRMATVNREYSENAVELAYASTADAAQGITVDRAILDVSGMGRSLLYSAATRGRQAPVFAGDLESALHIDDVAATMTELLRLQKAETAAGREAARHASAQAGLTLRIGKDAPAGQGIMQTLSGAVTRASVERHAGILQDRRKWAGVDHGVTVTFGGDVRLTEKILVLEHLLRQGVSLDAPALEKAGDRYALDQARERLNTHEPDGRQQAWYTLDLKQKAAWKEQEGAALIRADREGKLDALVAHLERYGSVDAAQHFQDAGFSVDGNGLYFHPDPNLPGVQKAWDALAAAQKRDMAMDIQKRAELLGYCVTSEQWTDAQRAADPEYQAIGKMIAENPSLKEIADSAYVHGGSRARQSITDTVKAIMSLSAEIRQAGGLVTPWHLAGFEGAGLRQVQVQGRVVITHPLEKVPEVRAAMDELLAIKVDVSRRPAPEPQKPATPPAYKPRGSGPS